MGLLKNKTLDNSKKSIIHFKKIAYAYQGYFSRGLVTFELPVLVPLVFSGQYELIVELLSDTIKRTDLEAGSDGFVSLLAQNQNSIPELVLEYAKFKLEEGYDITYSQKIESALININNSYDDFQYQIMLRWILFDYYRHSGDDLKAQYHHKTALQLSTVAGYNFFEMFLKVNALGVTKARQQTLLEEIKNQGFIPNAFLAN